MRADSEKAMLFYITHNHSINVRAYSGWGWETGFDLGIHATAPDSRHISVTSVTDSPNLTANATADLLFLFYESPGGNVTALLATALMISGPNDSTPCRSFRVRDISSSKSMALPPYVSKSGCTIMVANQDWELFAVPGLRCMITDHSVPCMTPYREPRSVYHSQAIAYRTIAAS